MSLKSGRTVSARRAKTSPSKRLAASIQSIWPVAQSGYKWIERPAAEPIPGIRKRLALEAMSLIERSGPEQEIWIDELDGQGPWLVPCDPSQGEKYVQPTQARHLLKKFLDIPTGIDQIEETKDHIIGFANTYGLLGPALMVLNYQDGGNERGESLRYWREQILKLQVLDRIWKTATCPVRSPKQVGEELSSYIQLPPGLIDLKGSWWGHGNRTAIGELDQIWVHDFQLPLPSPFQDEIGGPPKREHGRFVVDHLVNQELQRNVIPMLLDSYLQLVPATLLGAIYLDFAIRLPGTSQRRIRICKEFTCGKTFEPRRRDQVYCCPACKSKALNRNRPSQAKPKP